MNENIKKCFTKSLLAISIAGVSVVSQASSFALIEHSASGMGSAFAGASALGEDGSTIFFNPAAMTMLGGTQMVVGGHVILPNAEFANNGSTDANGAPLAGTNSDSDELGLVPNFYYTSELDNGAVVGLGVNVPFGLATDYDEGWVGRYHALHSEITTININPSIAWMATDNISVGFGVSLQYMELELTNNIDSFGACVNIQMSGGLSQAVAGANCVGAGLNGALGDASQDSEVKLDGDSLEMGWNMGVLVGVDDKTRLGISYRSAIKHNVSGDADYTLNTSLGLVAGGASASSGFNILQDTPLQAAAELPATFSVSLVHDINSKWTSLFDYTWTGWDSVDSITIRQSGGVPGQEPTLDLEYGNANRYSFGLNYKADAMWTYRGGVALDNTPSRSAEQTTARIPDNSRTWISFGVGYKPAADMSIDIGYSHLFIKNVAINNFGGASSSNATITGEYEASVDILSAQANFKF